jgi:hypothetical protein
LSDIRFWLSTKFTQELGFGFTDVEEIDAGVFEGRFIFAAILLHKSLNENQVIVSESRTVYDDVAFELDCTREILAISGGGTRIRKLLSAIGYLSHNRVANDAIYIQSLSNIRTIAPPRFMQLWSSGG